MSIFKVGNIVKDIFPYSANKQRLGVLLVLDHEFNISKEGCHLIKWEEGEESLYHPEYLRKVTKLDKALK